MKTILCIFIALLSGMASLSAQYLSDEMQVQWSKVWSDQVFVEKFLRSYGALSETDPKVSKDEVELFQELLELFTANPSAAAARLEEELKPDSSAAMYYTLATLYFQEQNLEKAQEYYQQAIKRFDEYRRAHKNLAIVYLMQGKLPEARREMHAAIELGERDGRLYGLLGYTYLSDENYLAAESAYGQAILLEPDMKDWKLGLAKSLLGMEKYAEANSLFQTLIEENPDQPEFWRLQVNTYLAMNQPKDAIANLEILRRSGHIQPPSRKLLGDIYMSLGMWDNALVAYGELIQDDPQGVYFEPALRVSRVLISRQDYDRALGMLNAAENSYATLDENQELALLNLKAKIARGQGDEELAMKTLESIIAHDPLNGDALLELAAVYADEGKLEEAEYKFQLAEKIEGYEFDALVKHARMLVKQKKYSKAVPMLKQALGYRDDPRVAEYLQKVERAARING